MDENKTYPVDAIAEAAVPAAESGAPSFVDSEPFDDHLSPGHSEVFAELTPPKPKWLRVKATVQAASARLATAQASKLKAKTLARTTPSAPRFLMVGSLQGCSRKDMLAYAKGLAEKYVDTPEIARYRIQEDKPNNRFLFEVHEGGTEYSILDNVLEAMARGDKVRIALANGGHVVIEDEHGELYSLAYPEPAEDEEAGGAQLAGVPVQAYAGTKKLDQVYPINRGFLYAGVAVLSASVLALLVSGGYYIKGTTNWGAQNDTALAVANLDFASGFDNNPVKTFKDAVEAYRMVGRPISFIRKKDGAWSYELEAPPAEQPVGAGPDQGSNQP